MPDPIDVRSSGEPRGVPLPLETYRYAAGPPPVDPSRPRWSAGRTAAVAGVTIVLVSAGAFGAVAAVPLGSGGQGAGPAGSLPGGGQFRQFRGGFGPNGSGQQSGRVGAGQQQSGQVGAGQQQSGQVGAGQQQSGQVGLSPKRLSRQDGAQLPGLPDLRSQQ